MKSSVQEIWLSEQLVSFSQPFSDLAYTICKTNNINGKCDVTDVSFAILITILIYRIIMSAKILREK